MPTMEMLLALFGLILLLVVAGCVLVLPIVALVRTQRIGGLDQRLARLERELFRLQALMQEAPAVAEVVLAEEPSPEPAPGPAAAPEELPTVIPVRPGRPPPPRTPSHIEEWVGGRGLGWAAVVLLLFAVAFFLKVAFDNQWVGELARVSLGVLLGTSLCVAGLRYHRRGWSAFSQMLTAAGVVLLYLSAFATFGFYHLLPRGHGAVFLIVLVVEAAALAVLYEAPAVALMAVVGGLLTPVLLHSDRDQYVSLFLYLTALNAGAVALSLLRRWPALTTVSLLGTYALFWAWYAEHYHPAKLGAALAFLTAIAALMLAQTVLATLLRRPTLWPAPLSATAGAVEDTLRSVLSSFLFALAGFVLLDPDYHAWMGALALGVAIVHTVVGWLVFARRPDDRRQVVVQMATAMAFVAAVFPLRADAAWIAVGWAVQGLALWAFGLRVREEGVRAIGAALLLLAAGRLLFVDTPNAHTAPFVPLFNRYGLPAVAVAGCVVAAGVIGRRYLARLSHPAEVVVRGTGLAGMALVWIVLSFEAHDYFSVQADRLLSGEPVPEGAEVYDAQDRPRQEARAEEAQHLLQSAQVALSVVWAVYAAVILAVGFRLPSQPLRWGALGLFGLTLAKVVLVDMGRLPGLYRVVAFLALALMMGVAAWGYQKMKAMFLADGREGAGHEPI